MEELTSLEKQIYFFIQKSEELLKDREKHEKRISQLETENEVLALKLNEIESKLNDAASEANIFGLTENTSETKNAFREQINQLITKIDFHLRS